MAHSLNPQTEAILKRIVSDIFAVDVAAISASFGPDECERWDSLSHLKLVAAIEQELGVELSPEEQAELLSFDLIAETVAAKL